MRILLERTDINLDTEDRYGRTPLLWAAGNGHEGVVRILLEQNVDPENAGGYGQTPLSRAAEYGNEGVVRMLLERNDVNPNTTDDDERTPLLSAARNRHEEVVRILLQCSEPSGGPAGDGGDNAKRTGRVAQDGTASRSPV